MFNVMKTEKIYIHATDCKKLISEQDFHPSMTE